MKRVKQAGFFLAGLIAAAAIFLGTNSVLAASVLKQIYVDYNPVKIFVDGIEKTPAGDMQPFIYNGRVYVALRFAGEALGKYAEWDGANRKVMIGQAPTTIQSWSETFTDSSLSKCWSKTGSWTFDGPNGIYSSGSKDDKLLVRGILPDQLCNYTVEFEAAISSRWADVFSVWLGTDSSNNMVDNLKFIPNYYGLFYRSDGDSSSRGDFIAEIEEPAVNEYTSIRLVVLDRQVSVYINGKYVTSQDLTMTKAAFGFSGRGTRSHIKNFKITVNP